MDIIFHRVIELDISLLSPLLDDFIAWGESVVGDRKPFLSLALVIDELFMNSLHHGGGARDHVELDASIHKTERIIELHYRDWGKAFDPSEMIHDEKRQTRQQLSLMERPIGGVGLSLIGALVTDFSYRQEGETNLLILRHAF